MDGIAAGGREIAWLGQQIRAQRGEILRQWVEEIARLAIVDRPDSIPARQRSDLLPEIIDGIVTVVGRPAEDAAHAAANETAALLGTHRFRQGATVQQIHREYDALSVLLEALVAREFEGQDAAARDAIDAMRRANEAVRALQRRTVDAFVAEYVRTLSGQTEKLRKFSRLVSHEIRQPLAVLQVIANALPVGTGDLDAARMLDLFGRNVRRLAEVTGRLERLARVTGATDVVPAEASVNLTELARAAARQLSADAIARGVQLIVRPDLPTVRLDRARAELVFINLLANGIRYADSAKPMRFVEVYSGRDEVPSVIVRDNGVGIPAPRLQHIFREFVRAHAQRGQEMAGLGVGLSIVRECMDAENGAVRVESIEGKGTTFKLTWPLR